MTRQVLLWEQPDGAIGSSPTLCPIRGITRRWTSRWKMATSTGRRMAWDHTKGKCHYSSPAMLVRCAHLDGHAVSGLRLPRTTALGPCDQHQCMVCVCRGWVFFSSMAFALSVLAVWFFFFFGCIKLLGERLLGFTVLSYTQLWEVAMSYW